MVNIRESFLQEYLGSLGLDTLAHARLGVDLEYFVSQRLGSDVIFREKATDEISQLVALLKSVSCVPVFVLRGLRTPERLAQLTSASGQKQVSFPAAGNFVPYFESSDIEFIIAPYSPWAQLAYMYKEGIVDTIYSSVDCLLRPEVDRVITSIAEHDKKFQFLDSKGFLDNLHISHRQFVEISCAVGCDIAPVPLIANAEFSELVPMARQASASGNPSVLLMLSQRLAKPTDLDTLKANICCADLMPIMERSGTVSCINSNAQVPSDAHNIIGQRLPNEFFYYLSVGLLDTPVLQSILSGKYTEPYIPESANAALVRSLPISSIVDIKNKSVNLMVMSMARYFQAKKIRYEPWFSTALDLDFRMPRPYFYDISHIAVKSHRNEFQISTFFQDLLQDSFIKDTTFESGIFRADNQKLKTLDDILSTTLLRTLYCYGFLNTKKATFSSGWGLVLRKIAEVSKDSKEIEALLLATISLKQHRLEFKGDAAKVLGQISVLASVLGLGAPSAKVQISSALKEAKFALQLVKTQFNELFQGLALASLTNLQATHTTIKSNKDWKKVAANAPLLTDLGSLQNCALFESLIKGDGKITKELQGILNFCEKFFEVMSTAEANGFVSNQYSENLQAAKVLFSKIK